MCNVTKEWDTYVVVGSQTEEELCEERQGTLAVIMMIVGRVCVCMHTSYAVEWPVTVEKLYTVGMAQLIESVLSLEAPFLGHVDGESFLVIVAVVE